MTFGFFSRRQWLATVLFVVLFAQRRVHAASNDSYYTYLWGPYRPNLYFGVRPRLPESLSTGLLWARLEEPQAMQNSFRYTCEQSDGMAGYGWDKYDARTGGTQNIYDVGNKIDVRTEFVKVPGGDHGGHWGVRISGTPRPDEPQDVQTTVIFSMTLEGEGEVDFTNKVDIKGYTDNLKFAGQTPELGKFSIEVTNGPKSNAHPFVQHPAAEDKPVDRAFVSSIQMPSEQIWQTKGIAFQMMKGEIDKILQKYGEENLPPAAQLFTIPNMHASPANVHMIQKIFQGPFEFDVLFSSASASKPMTSELLTKHIESSTKGFDSHFAKVFKPSPAFAAEKYQDFSKALFSNLLGGIGYFYGDSFVDRSNAEAFDEANDNFWVEAEEAKNKKELDVEGPYELFTSVPSRPFFPRGFLWDEGFHLLPISDWDVELTLEIVKSWYNLMDSDGWIAREQILGDEARSKVPMQFRIQYPHYANPPTLFLVVESLIERSEKDALSSVEKEQLMSYLPQLYPLLQSQFRWFRRTQKGDLKTYDRNPSSPKEAYRWRGRTPTHILTSGLDDYPRAQPPHPGELHVDLLSWVGVMARSLKRIAQVMEQNDDVAEFEGYEKAISQNLVDLHWNEKNKTFCDATVDEGEEHAHVCHKGYISIFPFITGMIKPDSPHLKPVLDLISDPEELWSEHGIRSLSKKDPNYGEGENYWRSPIWININYLVLKNLLDIAQASSGPHKKQAADIYTKLKGNLVETVYKSWKETGFAWEQYNPDTGAGQRTAHFTGWTSLIVKIIGMPDLGGKAGSGAPEHGEL